MNTYDYQDNINAYVASGRAKITVTRLVMQETGTYNPMYQRPYQTHFDQVNVDNLVRRIDQSGGTSVTGPLMAGLAADMVSPSAVPHGQITIPYGWTERRIRFVMDVAVTTNTGNSFVYVFQGYTSHLGVGMNGAVDPHMEFIINSFVRLNRTRIGNQMLDRITESAHVLNGYINYEFVDPNQGQIYTMRPVDVFTNMQSRYIENAISYHDKGSGMMDTRLSLTPNEPTRSSRLNNLPTQYLAKFADHYQHSVDLVNFGQGEKDVLDKCRQLTYESSVMENIFIRAMSNIKGGLYDTPSGTSFTFSQLEMLDPNVKAVTVYAKMGQTAQQQLPHVGQTAYWDSADRETVWATVLSNAIPALMMEMMLSKLRFRSTNHAIGSQITTVFIDAKSLMNTEIVHNLETFKTRLEREVLMDITLNNQVAFTLDAGVDLFGDTFIELSLDGGPMYRFTTPQFSDSLLTPVITHERNVLDLVINDFEQLANHLGVTDDSQYARQLLI